MDDIKERFEKTPLLFHLLYVAFILPFGVISNSVSFVYTLFSFRNSFDSLKLFSLCFTFIFILLGFLSLKGLRNFKISGLISLYVLQSLTIINGIVIAFLTKGSDLRILVLSSLIKIIFSISILVYYIKRRTLFTKKGLPSNLNQNEVEEEKPKFKYVPEKVNPLNIVKDNIENSEEKEPLVCPKCSRINENSAVFCRGCGYQLKSVNS